ncbi:unnamed protein product [Ranitomeya imitator]|uniref:G-protein coupled receptors family 1 profile domain-containing protein n=1 Tax=Ranitomeya imitator TaxID=111125 RepID=A0ABN9M9R5_9NEOB|nr:unnamed protein product [Ranitomeya imitator]
MGSRRYKSQRHCREPADSTGTQMGSRRNRSQWNYRGPADGTGTRQSYAGEMNESLNDSDASFSEPWIQTSDVNGSLELSAFFSVFTINPWDIMLCISGTIIACENAIVVAIIFYTPTLRTPMFVLIGSLATADLLAGFGLILNFVFQYVIQSETINLITVGFLVASFTASVSSLLAITVDRYLSLYNALTYSSEKTILWIHLMLVVTWGVSICLGLLPVLGWNCLDDISSCSIVSPLTKKIPMVVQCFDFSITLGTDSIEQCSPSPVLKSHQQVMFSGFP